jgi:hypothetical protein
LKPLRARLRRSPSSHGTTLVNQDSAAWFASLPSAIRRKHFTKEEQVLFANERHSVILDAADELFHRRCSPDTFPNPSRPQTSYFPETTDGHSFYNDTDSDIDPLEVREDDMANYSLEKFPWLDEEPKLDLRIDDYHNAIAETARRQSEADQRRSFRRNLSLSTLSLRRSSVTSGQANNSVVGRSATPSILNHRSSILPPASPMQHHRSKASILSIDPRATHYQDPAARMKLRVYLASASKFDEAVEFGFPSLQEKNRSQHERPKTSPRLTNESGRTFFTDDTPSLLRDDASSHDEIETTQDPRTPEDAEFRIHRKSQKSSSERMGLRPQVVRTTNEQYAQSSTLDREMTIHMTLTRPDLRSPEEQQPGKVNSLPLEQAALPNLDNNTSIWDTLPEDESKVKRLWRRLKMR